MLIQLLIFVLLLMVFYIFIHKNYKFFKEEKYYSKILIIIFLGTCELNKLRIYANPNSYILKFDLNNFDDDINMNFNEIEIVVESCNKDQIKMYDKNKIVHCENPVCYSTCPEGERASCIAKYKEHINDMFLNICQCLPVYTGNLCEYRVFADFGYVYIYIYIYIITS